MNLQLGGSPNGLPNKGGTALHRAVHMKRVAITKILIEHEADLTFMVCTHGGLL
jgi:ankyrin repeat protein